jgi:hypothetical protein
MVQLINPSIIFYSGFLIKVIKVGKIESSGKSKEGRLRNEVIKKRRIAMNLLKNNCEAATLKRINLVPLNKNRVSVIVESIAF